MSLIQTESFKNDKLLNYKYYVDKNYYSERYRSLILIGHFLRKYKPFNELKNDELIIEKIELSCFNKAKNKCLKLSIRDDSVFNRYYKSIVYRIICNLRFDKKDENSYYLVKAIVNKKININNIAKLDSTILNPLKNLTLVRTINVRKKQRIKKKYTTKYTCPLCKQNKCTSVDKQLRGLDEGVTHIITCENEFCGHTWKINS